jgi:hypothetical protein
MRCCKTCTRGCERERERKRERRQLLGGESVGRCHGPLEELALGLRHGDARAAGRGLRGGRRSRGKEAVAAGAGQGTGGRARGEGHPYLMMPTDLVKRVVEACGWRAEGELGEGVVRLMGGGGRAGRFKTRGIVQGGAWKDRWRKIILDASMTIMSAHKSAKKEDFYWLY